MTTETSELDTHELEQRVKSMYEEVALEPDREFHFETGRPLAERLGYPTRRASWPSAAGSTTWSSVRATSRSRRPTTQASIA
jgi:hypothetical protein